MEEGHVPSNCWCEYDSDSGISGTSLSRYAPHQAYLRSHHCCMILHAARPILLAVDMILGQAQPLDRQDRDGMSARPYHSK